MENDFCRCNQLRLQIKRFTYGKIIFVVVFLDPSTKKTSRHFQQVLMDLSTLRSKELCPIKVTIAWRSKRAIRTCTIIWSNPSLAHAGFHLFIVAAVPSPTWFVSQVPKHKKMIIRKRICLNNKEQFYLIIEVCSSSSHALVFVMH